MFKEKLFTILGGLQKSATENNQTDAENLIEDLLLTPFRVVQTQDLLTNEEIQAVQEKLLFGFQHFKYLLDLLVLRYYQGKYISYLTYRSGLHFLTVELDKMSKEPIKTNCEYENTCNDLQEILKEFKEILEAQEDAPIDPFAPHEPSEDLRKIPSSHNWWNSFR